jgi:hypothetical protein
MIAEAVANQNLPQKAAPETPVDQKATEATSVKELISPKIQLLVQREKKALEIETRAKQREAGLLAKIKDLEEREKKISEFESMKSTNPMGALERMGLSYKDLTDVALNDGNVTPEIQVKKLEEKFESYLKSQEAAERDRHEQSQKAASANEERVVAEFKTSINQHIESDPKKYELIRFEGAQELVFDVIDEHYNKTIDPTTGKGKILSISEAADKVESFYKKKYEDAKKLEIFKQQVPQVPRFGAEKPQEFIARPKQRTLTNNLSATPAAPKTRALTDDERIAKAVAYARGLRP